MLVADSGSVEQGTSASKSGSRGNRQEKQRPGIIGDALRFSTEGSGETPALARELYVVLFPCSTITGYLWKMPSQNFLRLPEAVQELVTEGLDAEVQASFARIEEAQAAGDNTQIRFLEGDIMRASALRQKLTGEDVRL